jgi:hypothetical protein
MPFCKGVEVSKLAKHTEVSKAAKHTPLLSLRVWGVLLFRAIQLLDRAKNSQWGREVASNGGERWRGGRGFRSVIPSHRRMTSYALTVDVRRGRMAADLEMRRCRET